LLPFQGEFIDSSALITLFPIESKIIFDTRQQQRLQQQPRNSFHIPIAPINSADFFPFSFVCFQLVCSSFITSLGQTAEQQKLAQVPALNCQIASKKFSASKVLPSNSLHTSSLQ